MAEAAAVINRNEYMEDARGRLVPRDNIEEIDLSRDGLVRHLVANGQKLQDEMVKYKDIALSEVKAFIELSAEEYGVELGGRKGNVSLISFDGRYKIQVQIGESLAFDERLKVAKKMIDECLQRWTQGGNSNIKALVDDVFQVDQEGRINIKRILELRRLKVEDTLWNEAMGIIGKSLQVVSTKEYFRLYKRIPPDDKWQCITLDMAAL